ncbi:MAG: chemotaxis protein CheB [Spirochaetia bacterium]
MSTTSPEYTPQQEHAQPKREFYAVGIGASAGGLEALEIFFDNIPPLPDFAFVVVQHLSPDYESLMGELLRKHTQLSIHEAEDRITVEPGNIYLMPRKKT